MQMKREYIFLASWLQYALLGLGYPLVTILAWDAWCCLWCTILGLGSGNAVLARLFDILGGRANLEEILCPCCFVRLFLP